MPPEAILAFDTSAAHCAAALLSGGRVFLRTEAMDKGQAERLLPLLEELLAEGGIGWHDLAGIGVGTDLEYFETHFGRVVDGKGVRARYVRGYTNGSNLWRGNSWQELEVYGLPADSRSGVAIPSSTNSVAKDTEPLKLQLPAPTLK